MLLAGHQRRCCTCVDATTPRLVPEEWRYVNEGGANVVFRFIGEELSPLKGYVMRIRKEDVKGATPQDIVEFATKNQPLNSAVEYVQVARAVAVEKSFLIEMNAILVASPRPAHREANLHLDLPYVMLLPDIAFPSIDEPSLCVELKPKHGRCYTENDMVHPNKRLACRFCLHQHLKHSQGKIHSLSRYCPLALFSTDRSLREMALEALMATPQNNFRLFSSESTFGWDMAEIRSILLELFLRVPVLQDLQAMHELDVLDVEGMYSLSQIDDLLSQHNDKEATLGSLLKDLSPSSIHYLVLATGGQWQDVSLAAWNQLYQQLYHNFMVATTYKDCSLLIAIQRTTESSSRTDVEHLITLASGDVFKCKVAIVDLDTKHHKSIAHYYKLDQTIALHAKSDAQKTCAIAQTKLEQRC